MAKLNNTDISLAGEYYVAAMMHIRGWNASMTLKNYPGIDILGYDPNTGKQSTIQVKTGNNKYTVLTGIKLGDFSTKIKSITQPYVFVHLDNNGNIECFILTAKDFITLAIKAHSKMLSKGNGNNALIKFKWIDLKPFKDQWNNLW